MKIEIIEGPSAKLARQNATQFLFSIIKRDIQNKKGFHQKQEIEWLEELLERSK
ncbi:hypothetical protein PU629_07055 [Pullulanibacillus sp. KACC 23026]|uniref:hypothetical protein n=1 Tax=Pullulanibacillus sp. KACC 23026 TaxID=3028315 RepID=UPI0023B0148A|nr:hypothetical protein [Pullulanibacillus sp. KACC 23026]WEG14117.1 hypothetical protein PU629_07055 [Pullulanibacillus sp. KACC 23026]